QMKWVVILLLPPLIAALSYRCDNDEVLIVQSFGNDSIRMHCQRLNLCGFAHLKCTYDPLQPLCGGKTNFVAHVSQLTPTGPVTHTCCDLKINPSSSVPTHDGNDCFVYELPDGTKRSNEVKPNIDDEHEYTLLKAANKIPEQFANYTGYHLRLFILKNKSPPTLLVKGIERRPDGYRVTICRPRCDQRPTSKDSEHQKTSSTQSSSTTKGISRENEWRANATKNGEEAVSSSVSSLNKSTSNGPEVGTLYKQTQIIKMPEVGEWLVATWSAWTTNKWASWTHREWSEYGDISGGTHSRGDRYRIGKADATNGDKNSPFGGPGQRAATDKESSARMPEEEGSNQKNNSTERLAKNTVNIIVDGDQPSQTETNESSGQRSQSGQRETLEGGGDEGRSGKSWSQEEHGRMNKNTNSITDGRAEVGGGKPEGKKENENKTEDHDKEPTGSAPSSQNGEVKEPSNETSTANRERPEGITIHGKEASTQASEQKKVNGTKSATISSPNVGEKKNETDKGNQMKENLESSRPESGNTGVEKLPSKFNQEIKEKEYSKGSDGNEGIKKTEATNGDNLQKAQTAKNEKNTTDDGKQTGRDSDESEIPENEEEEQGESGEINPNDLRKKEEENKNEKTEAKKGEQNVGKGSTTEERNGTSSKKADDGKEKAAQQKPTEERSQTKNTSVEEEMIKALSPTSAPPGTRVLTSGQSGESETLAGTSNVGANAKAGAAKIHPIEAGATGGAKKTDDKSGDGEKSSGEVKEPPVAKDNGGGERDTEATGKVPYRKTLNNTSDAKKAAARLITGGTGATMPDSIGEKALAELMASGGGSAAPGASSASAAPAALAVGGGGASARLNPRALGRARSNCFSADTTVRTYSGLKKMKELEVGDYVLVPASGNVLKYERVEMFYHREPETRAKFVVIETESGHSLSLTELHLLPLGQCNEMQNNIMDIQNVDEWMYKSRFAHKARPGDCVLSIGDQGGLQVDRIVKVGRRFLKGIYSPMTVEGAIVTNGVLASCFSQVENHFIQKLILDVVIMLHRCFGRLVISLNSPIQHLPSLIEFI
uniref:Hint domain-containing protein n=1 Tax=Parascaris univalens TaxID=6257 RepID=A0A915BDD0_PARUN